jgi:RNA polymerase sigma-70 factor (family 1)
MYHQRPIALEEEKNLLILLNQGDEQAFEKIYHFYSILILKKLLRLVKDEDLAKELLQDIFLKVWERRESLQPDKSFKSYLFRITENQVIDLFRRAASDRKIMDHLTRISSELYNHTEDLINFKECNAFLQQAIESLPPQRKKIFTLCKVEGRSYEDAGKLLGISSGTVNDHMVKAVRSLKKQLTANDLVLIILINELMTSFINPL